MDTCKHPPHRLYCWFAITPTEAVLCVACCDCGAVLAGDAAQEAADELNATQPEGTN